MSAVGQNAGVLEFPELVLGLARDVKSRSRRVVTALRKGKDWQGLLKPTISHDRARLIVLDGPSPLVGGEVHLHVYLPTQVIFEAELKGEVSRDDVDRYLAHCLSTSWGTLSLQGQMGQIPLTAADFRLAFLRSCLRYWHLFEALGNKYSSGSNSGSSIWSASRCIYFALAREGMDKDVLRDISQAALMRNRRPKGGLHSVLEQSGLREHLANH